MTRAAAVAAACSLVLACCGGDEDHPTPSEPPAELLAKAVADPATSGQAALDVDLDLEGDTILAGAAGFEATGPFDLGDGTGLPAFEFDGEGEAAGFGLDTDLISTGEDAFVIFFGENYRVGPERFAEAEAALAGADGDGGPGLDVASWIRKPAYAGTEEVGGTDTERITGTLDPEAASAAFRRAARALGASPLLAAFAEGIGAGEGEAWVAYEDQTIRRVRGEFAFVTPPEQVTAARGVESGTVTIDAEISDVGADVTIGVPEGGGFQPIDQLGARLESLASLGGL